MLHHGKPRFTTTVITPAAVEPVTELELLTQLGMSMPDDPAAQQQVTAQMLSLIRAAREDCENDMRRALMMQTRQTQMTSFPGRHAEGFLGSGNFWGQRRSSESFDVPSAPLMAIVSLSYLDLTGTAQTIPYDPSLGTAANLPQYTYQRSLGTETLPGRISPGRYHCWPWTHEGDGVVTLVFRCGYNGPVAVTTTANSTALTATGFTFLPDDVGRPIRIPGAGASAGVLATTIASVMDGEATLAAAATAAAVNATATFGVPVPENIRRAILIRAEGYYQNDYNQKRQDWVQDRLKPYRVS